MHSGNTAIAVCAAGLILLGGCAGQPASEATFGDAVRHMKQQQIYDKDAALNPDPAVVEGGDVERLNNVLDSHRNDVADSTAISGDAFSGVGGSDR